MGPLPLRSQFCSIEGIIDNVTHLAAPLRGVHIVADNIRQEALKGMEATGKFFGLGGSLERQILPYIKGFVTRIKTGPTLQFFYGQRHSEEIQLKMHHLHNFNVVLDSTLSQPEMDKAWQMIRALAHQRESELQRLVAERINTNATPNSNLVESLSKEISDIEKFLTKIQRHNIPRSQFEKDEWEVLDKIDFELSKDHFRCLCELFNNDALNSLRFQEGMEQYFGVNYKEALIAEALAKALAYIGDLNGKDISLPIKDPSNAQGAYKLVSYRIKDLTLGDALPCYILESDDPLARPWITIRGTQTFTGRSKEGSEFRAGSLESILTDGIDPNGIGRHAVDKAMVHRPIVCENGRWVQKESLIDVFEKWQEQRKQVNLAGHSLGGYFANDLAVRFFAQVNAAYGFNGPAVGREISCLWHKKVVDEAARTGKALQEIERKIVNFDNEGDIVPSGGHEFIGLHLAIEHESSSRKNLLHHHLRHVLTRNFTAQRIDNALENRKGARRLIETSRRVFGMMLRGLLHGLNKRSIPDWWKNRKVYANALRINNRAVGLRFDDHPR